MKMPHRILKIASVPDVIKKYEYETPDTTFSVELILPTQDYYSTVHKDVDITKYTPILEAAASSLKLK